MCIDDILGGNNFIMFAEFIGALNLRFNIKFSPIQV